MAALKLSALAVLLLALPGQANFDYANLGGLGGLGGKKCSSFRCAKDQEVVPSWPLLVKSTGCSGIGGGMTTLSMSTDGDGEHLERCCDLRHACLQICGIKKKVCDSRFEACTKKACETQPLIPQASGPPKNCSTTITLKVLMAQMEGCKLYDTLQRQNCRCKKKSTARKARAKFLSKFYKRYAKGKEVDTKALAKKHGKSKGRFGTLVLRLVEKYPKSIKHVQDPRQKQMEEMMRKIREEDEAKKAKEKNDDSRDGQTAPGNKNEEQEDQSIPKEKIQSAQNSDISDEEEEIELLDDDSHSEL